ncbi:hypothetical protein QTO34_008024 [Cnephaeus nilssonii]|uniref:Uncharacterized protein n=1 Tax=Cnephaeus nilssonii TaxID=3371016 RepID=A0AA40I9Q1_CNENI|nr:hypothetical protein QTO34_008024 [Eptesicus nilssonii]
MVYTGRYFDNASYRCSVSWEMASLGKTLSKRHWLSVLTTIWMISWPSSTVASFPSETAWTSIRSAVKPLVTQVKNKPTAVIAKTFKGQGIPSLEDAENWHGKPMPTERADAVIKLVESQIETYRQLEPKPPIEDSPKINITDIEMTSLSA